MPEPRRRDRRPARRIRREPARHRAPQLDVAGAEVVLVGWFSAKQKDHEARTASAAAGLASCGARVVGQFVQRRGASDGGAKMMDRPFSSRTVLSRGKVQEVAEACDRADADAVVFLTALTEHQRRVLTEVLGRPVVGISDILNQPPRGPSAPAFP